MSAKYMHIGIPVTNKKPGMTYVDGMKLWMSNPDDHDYKIEYLKFEEGGPFPEIIYGLSGGMRDLLCKYDNNSRARETLRAMRG